MNGIFINSNRGTIKITTYRPMDFQDGDLRDILNCGEDEQVTCLLSEAKEDYFRELTEVLEENESLNLADVLSEHDWFADGLEELDIFSKISSINNYSADSLEDFRDEQRDYLRAFGREV